LFNFEYKAHVEFINRSFVCIFIVQQVALVELRVKLILRISV